MKPPLTIEILPLKQVLDEAVETIEAVQAGKHVEPRRRLSFDSVDDFRRFFTERRMEMLSAIRHRQPHSVYGLAKMLKRDLKSVNTDLDILIEIGVVSVRKKKAKTRTGYKKVPHVGFDRLVLEMVV